MKQGLKENLKNAIARVEHLISMGKFGLKEHFNLLEPIKIFPYHGFGNKNYVFIKGTNWRRSKRIAKKIRNKYPVVLFTG